jgi:hypothetical protein
VLLLRDAGPASITARVPSVVECGMVGFRCTFTIVRPGPDEGGVVGATAALPTSVKGVGASSTVAVVVAVLDVICSAGVAPDGSHDDTFAAPPSAREEEEAGMMVRVGGAAAMPAEAALRVTCTADGLFSSERSVAASRVLIRGEERFESQESGDGDTSFTPLLPVRTRRRKLRCNGSDFSRGGVICDGVVVPPRPLVTAELRERVVAPDFVTPPDADSSRSRLVVKASRVSGTPLMESSGGVRSESLSALRPPSLIADEMEY